VAPAGVIDAGSSPAGGCWDALARSERPVATAEDEGISVASVCAAPPAGAAHM